MTPAALVHREVEPLEDLPDTAEVGTPALLFASLETELPAEAAASPGAPRPVARFLRGHPALEAGLVGAVALVATVVVVGLALPSPDLAHPGFVEQGPASEAEPFPGEIAVCWEGSRQVRCTGTQASGASSPSPPATQIGAKQDPSVGEGTGCWVRVERVINQSPFSVRLRAGLQEREGSRVTDVADWLLAPEGAIEDSHTLKCDGTSSDMASGRYALVVYAVASDSLGGEWKDFESQGIGKADRPWTGPTVVRPCSPECDIHRTWGIGVSEQATLVIAEV